MIPDSFLKPSIAFKPMFLGMAIVVGMVTEPAHAGPLLDWLFGRSSNAPAYPVGQPVPLGNGYSAGYGVYPRQTYPPNGYAPAGYGYRPAYTSNYGTYYGSQLPVIGNGAAAYTAPAPSGITAATLPPTVSYLPNFRSNSYRAPVTYYRPLMTTDPVTGSQVVSMAPCTSYEYQTGRVPTTGRTAYYGPSLVPQAQPAPRALPTYTLPSGGIPLASNYPTTPYSSAYGSYSTLQPGTAYPPATTYPSSPYYDGSFSGGSTGSYLPPSSSTSSVPGLVAPQAPGTVITPAPTNGQRIPAPYGAAPSESVMPPAMNNPGFPAPATPGIGSDPRGSVAPTLPADASARNGSLRPRVQSITRTPERQSYAGRRMQPIEQHSANSAPSGYADRNRMPNYPKVDVPSLRTNPFSSNDNVETNTAPVGSTLSPEIAPIPVPENFKLKPRWNPGLLREEDMTALRPIAPEVAQYAGQSKKIHWASFEEPRVAKPTGRNEVEQRRSLAKPSYRTENVRQFRPIEGAGNGSRTSSTGRGSVDTARTQQNASQRYDSRGWKTKR